VNNNGLQLTTKATLLLFLGWLLMIVGLFIPVIHIPIPDPHMAPLLFLGIPIPNVNDDGSMKIVSHASIEGIRIIAFIIITLLKKMSFKLAWLALMTLSLPLFLALLAPIQIWIKSFRINIILALMYGFWLIIPGVSLLISAKDNLIGPGYYFWTIALLMLCSSRILVCVSSWKNKND